MLSSSPRCILAVVVLSTTLWRTTAAEPPQQLSESLPPELIEARAALRSGDSDRALELAEKYMWATRTTLEDTSW